MGDNPNGADAALYRKKLLGELLEKKDNHDVFLVAEDGTTEIGCNRAILVNASEVFKKMLHRQDGNFVESKTAKVKTQFNSTVLEALLSYLYTGGLTETKKRKAPHDGDMKPDMGYVQDILSLCHAADYYAIPKLPGIVSGRILNVVKEYPLASFAIFSSCSKDYSEYDSSFEQSMQNLAETALVAIGDAIGQIKTSDCSDMDVVSPISADAMAKILGDSRLHATELHLFQVLLLWAKFKPKEESMGLAAHIKLDKILPEDFQQVVAPSDLVSLEDLLAASMQQAQQLFEIAKESYPKGCNPLMYFQHRKPWTDKMRSLRPGNATPDVPRRIKISGTNGPCDQVLHYRDQGFYNSSSSTETADGACDVELTIKDVNGFPQWVLEELWVDTSGDEEESDQHWTVCRYAKRQVDANDPCPRPSDVWCKKREDNDNEDEEEEEDEEVEGLKIEYHYDGIFLPSD